MMLLDGQWMQEDDDWRLKLGSIFAAKITRRGEPGVYGMRWVAILNGQQVTTSPDLEYAKGYIEWEIVKEMTNLSAAYRALKGRAPSSSDIFPDGAWARWKARQKVR